MKTWLALCALLGVAASPCMAQTIAKDETTINNYIRNGHLVGDCVTIDFAYDADLSGKKLDAVQKRLLAKGVSQAKLNTLIVQAEAQGDSYDFSAEMNDAIQPDDMAASLKAMQAVFGTLQNRCDALAADPDFANVITRAGYQLTNGPKSYLGQTLYQAQTGNPHKYVMAGMMYSAGVTPDPDHVLEFNAYMAGAEAGDASSADLLASNYLGGVGTTENDVQAEKWAVIADNLGSSDALPLVDERITPAQKTQGQALAQAWLKAHGR